MERFLEQHAIARGADGRRRITVLKLLEMQRHAMLMYTSCGWFFDELSGIETVQVIQYAGAGDPAGAGALRRRIWKRSSWNSSEQAKSNIPEHRDGRRIYEKFVKPAMVDLRKGGRPLCHPLRFSTLCRT